MVGECLESVGKLWPESVVVLDESASGAGELLLSFSDTLINLGVVITIITFFLISFARIADGIATVVTSVFSYKDLMKMEEQTNLYTNRNILLIFSLLVFAFMFSNSGIVSDYMGEEFSAGAAFIITVLLFLFYFLFRNLSFFVLNWVNRCKLFKYLSRVYYTHIALGLVLSAAGLLVYMLFPGIGRSFLACYFAVSLSAVIVMYFVRGNQIIISNGFSHFFWILYLCTLEILPLVVIGHVMFS